MDLSPQDQDSLSGHHGPARQLAMELVLQAARILKAPHLIPVTYAHLDACFYAGQAHVDFAQFMLEDPRILLHYPREPFAAPATLRNEMNSCQASTNVGRRVQERVGVCFNEKSNRFLTSMAVLITESS